MLVTRNSAWPGVEYGVPFDPTLRRSPLRRLISLATDAAAYMNVGQGWMKAPPTDALSEMAAEFGGAFDSQVISESTWVYKAEVPCGDDICWQVESPDGVLMNLTRNDYSPVSMTIVEDGAEILVDILHWDDAVEVEFPADAREVTSEEVMISLLGARLPVMAGGL